MRPISSWTIHIVRTDGLESHTLRLGKGRLSAIIGLLALILLGGGTALGLYWASRSESETVLGLQREAEALRGDRARVAELAARLSDMEGRYRRLQEAVTAGRPDVSRLPPVPVEPGIVRREEEPTGLAWPLARGGFVTRNFGSLGEGSRDGHTGVDIAVPTGSYVRAIRGGVVEEAGLDPVYGNFVRIAHADGLTSLYGHNSWLFASVGDSVDRLQVIALSGNTGRSTAPHLHLELLENGSLVDPLAYVSEEATRASASVGTQPR